MKLVDTLFNQIPELKPMSGVCRDSLTRIGACQMSVLRGTYRSKYEKYEDFIDVDGLVKNDFLSVNHIIPVFQGRFFNSLHVHYKQIP